MFTHISWRQYVAFILDAASFYYLGVRVFVLIFPDMYALRLHHLQRYVRNLQATSYETPPVLI